MLCYVPQEVQGFKTVGEMERFLLEHGEQIVDVLGSEVDRIEDRIKVSVWVSVCVLGWQAAMADVLD